MAPESYSWSEGIDESLNFWFWLRGKGDIDDVALVERIHEWAGCNIAAQHSEASKHESWSEYLSVWPSWKRSHADLWVEQATRSALGEMRSHYKAMAATGTELRVEWVMAPSGARWLVPPDLAILSAEGLTTASRQAAVLEAATALQERRT